MNNVFEIKVNATDVPARVLMFIKQKTNASLSQIKNSIKKGTPIYGCGLSDDSGIVRIIDMYEQLSAMGIQAILLEDGKPESIELFKNTLESHIDTAKEIGLADYFEEIQGN